MDYGGFPQTIEESRRVLLDAIGPAPDLTFVRGHGNRGDELIWAGTRALLAHHVVREVGAEEIGEAEGELVLLSGGGAWCRSYHEYMPPLLAVAEHRFERVIVLPSSFDTAEQEVVEALRASRAKFFARDAASYRRIAGLCDAAMAHDCSFFFDLQPHDKPGNGTLDAFRTDADAPPGEPPADNDDISDTCATLEEWLGRIAAVDHVRTDRAHVMLAAALMGKRVQASPIAYDKVQALAETLPAGAGELVRMAASPRTPPPPGARPAAPALEAVHAHVARQRPVPVARDRPSAVTAFILSRDRPEQLAACVRSVLAADVGARVLILDNNSGPFTRAVVNELAAEQPEVELLMADRNLGTAGGRSLAATLVHSDYTLFIDDDAELMPGALQRLVADLEAHPQASGVTSLVVSATGVVQHFGGWPEISRDAAAFPLEGRGLRFDSAELPPTGPCGWLPGTGALVRTQLLREVPIDPAMTAYYEDNDWSLRVTQRDPGAFRRCREAIVMHHGEGGSPPGARLEQRWRTAGLLMAHAHFLRRHGKVIANELQILVPELRTRDGGLDLPSARLLLALVEAYGPRWLLAQWQGDGLAPLLRAPWLEPLEDDVARLQAEVHQLEPLEDDVARLQAELHQLEPLEDDVARLQAEVHLLEPKAETLAAIEAGGWWRLRGRLAPVLRPASRARKWLTR